MKKYLVFLSIFLLTACTMPKQDPSQEIKTINNSTKTVIAENFTGSKYKGNYIYGAAMGLAWNELTDTIIHEPIQLKSNNADALHTLSKLNAAAFTTSDLDEKSYYVKSGFGQETVDVINQESRAKFPQKSFADLDVKLAERDIIAYAYLAKEVEYMVPFGEEDMLFEPRHDDISQKADMETGSVKPLPLKKVASFSADNDEQRKNVGVVKYWDDHKFIVSLRLKDPSDQLFVAKGFNLESPDEVMREIHQYQERQQFALDQLVPQTLMENDLFEMPYLTLDYRRDYQEMIGQILANKNFEDYAIAQMFENIKFKMDYKGAKVENEAVIQMASTAAPIENSPQIRRFIVDKPFWVIMKRTGSNNPYFILGVNNTEFMKTLEY